MPTRDNIKFQIHVNKLYKKQWSLGLAITHDGDFGETYLWLNMVKFNIQIGMMN